MSFPSISNPKSIEEIYTFNTISQEFDGGYKQTRERHSRVLKTITVTYSLLTTDEKNLLKTHFLSVRGSTPFLFKNIDSGEEYSVRYTEYPAITADASLPHLYAISIKMETV